jgi:hypothetical protein
VWRVDPVRLRRGLSSRLLAAGFLSALACCGSLAAIAQDAPAASSQNGTPASGTPATSAPSVPPSAPVAPASSASTAADASKKAQARKKDSDAVSTGAPLKATALRDERKAAKFYLEGVRLIQKARPEAAWHLLTQAAKLEPENTTYAHAAEVARQSAVSQLVHQSSQEAVKGATTSATSLLQHALEIDPQNPTALNRLHGLADEAASAPIGTTASTAAGADNETAPTSIESAAIELKPNAEKHSFHLHADAQQMVQQVFRAYGIDASIHESVQRKQVRLDVDDLTFAQATRVLAMVTKTFYEPLDPHRVIVALDSPQNRTQFQREQTETIYLPGLTDKELTDVGSMAKAVFDVQQSLIQPTKGTITLRTSEKKLNAFNHTIMELEDGKSQLDLNIKIIQLSRVSARETGTTFLQQTGVYNVLSEVTSVLSQNQSLVQQVIASGLVANANTLTNQVEILAILVASGELTGTPFNQGFVPFGGGLTQSIVTPGSATLAMSLTSSDTRTLDDIHMRLSDDEAGTIKSGMRYPIETSSYSSTALPAVSGVVTSALQSQTVPQIQYEDLGLIFKATPKIMRSDDVALTLDLKIESLEGSSLNDIPILDSQQFTGVLTLRAGETAVLLSDLTRQESRALNGLPGVSDIPGLQDVSDVVRDQNVARLLILVTPAVVRDPRYILRGPRLSMDKTASSH